MILILFLLVLAGAAPVAAQSSICSAPADTDAVLTICIHERGMVPRPQPRLFIRVFADGRAEYEQNVQGTSPRLATKQFGITSEQLNEILCLGREPDFQAAVDHYPAVHKGIDSSRETTITFRDSGAVKTIVITGLTSMTTPNIIPRHSTP